MSAPDAMPSVAIRARRRHSSATKRIVANLSGVYGVTPQVEIAQSQQLTWNDPTLARATAASLIELPATAMSTAMRVLSLSLRISRHTNSIPGLFHFLGVSADGADPARSPPNPHHCSTSMGVRWLRELAHMCSQRFDIWSARIGAYWV